MSTLLDFSEVHAGKSRIWENISGAMQPTLADLVVEAERGGEADLSGVSVSPAGDGNGMTVRMEMQVEYDDFKPIPEAHKGTMLEFHREWLRKQMSEEYKRSLLDGSI